MSQIACRALFALCLWLVGAQATLAQNAQSAVARAARATGIEGLTSIRLFGSGANYTIGQNNNAEGPWPRTNLNDLNRWIDFDQPATRATAVTHAVPVTGGPAVQGAFNQAASPGALNWAQHLEIWTTPWGFLIGASRNPASLETRVIGGTRFQVVTWSPPQKSPAGAPYRVVGYIGPDGLVRQVDTWIENPVFGDLAVETRFSNYRDAAGLKFPTTIVQSRGGWPTFEAQILGVQANPADIRERVAPPAAGAPPPPPPPPPQAQPASASEQLAPGVWRIKGAYNALAIEFQDYALLFEPGPQNNDRARAIIEETRRLIPGKPIRYGVISHHHFDHTSGLPAVAAAGITIVTPQGNKAFFERALNGPRTLAPDDLSRSGRKAVIEGFTGDKRVFQDAAQTFEVHVIKGLPHADNLVVGYLPRERILVYADMFNLPPAANPVPNPPVIGTGVFLDNIERLGLKPDRIMSVHNLNPDRLATLEDIRRSLGR